MQHELIFSVFLYHQQLACSSLHLPRLLLLFFVIFFCSDIKESFFFFIFYYYYLLLLQMTHSFKLHSSRTNKKLQVMSSQSTSPPLCSQIKRYNLLKKSTDKLRQY